MAKEIKLKVADAISDDVNKCIARIDFPFMAEIGISPGDIVEIEGEGKTLAIAGKPYPGDVGLNIIRIDRNLRRGINVKIRDIVTVKKYDSKENSRV